MSMPGVEKINGEAEVAAMHAKNAVARAAENGHGNEVAVAHAVSRTYLEGVFEDEPLIAEAHGIALRCLQKELVSVEVG